MPISNEDFRSALSRFASGVTIVTTKGSDGQNRGLTVSSFCSLSLNPPLILVCIDQQATIHDHLTEGRFFAVHILNEEQEALSRRFAAKDPDRFAGLAYKESIEGTPLLDDVLACLECRIVAAYEGGDHTIFIGEVETAVIRDRKPLLYYRGGYGNLL